MSSCRPSRGLDTRLIESADLSAMSFADMPQRRRVTDSRPARNELIEIVRRGLVRIGSKWMLSSYTAARRAINRVAQPSGRIRAAVGGRPRIAIALPFKRNEMPILSPLNAVIGIWLSPTAYDTSLAGRPTNHVAPIITMAPSASKAVKARRSGVLTVARLIADHALLTFCNSTLSPIAHLAVVITDAQMRGPSRLRCCAPI